MKIRLSFTQCVLIGLVVLAVAAALRATYPLPGA